MKYEIAVAKRVRQALDNERTAAAYVVLARKNADEMQEMLIIATERLRDAQVTKALALAEMATFE